MSRSRTRTSEYLLAGQASELERLQLQSLVWEPSGRRLLAEIGEGRGARALDVGCGALGWLRVLSEWVGPDGQVTGTDIDEAMLSAANQFVTREGLRNVGLVKDDLFASELEPDSFDLVHARYEICPLGRGHEQMETYVRLARPGGVIVLEDPDPGSWHFNPPAPALEQLVALTIEAFRLAGGDWGASRYHRRLLRDFGIEGNVGAEEADELERLGAGVLPAVPGERGCDGDRSLRCLPPVVAGGHDARALQHDEDLVGRVGVRGDPLAGIDLEIHDGVRRSGRRADRHRQPRLPTRVVADREVGRLELLEQRRLRQVGDGGRAHLHLLLLIGL